MAGMLGRNYFHGVLTKDAGLYTIGAAEGVEDALADYANCLLKSLGLETNEKGAIVFLKIAVNSGSAYDLELLEDCYTLDGVLKNCDTAFHLARKEQI